MQLKKYGTLQDILNSNASAEFKSACVEMGRSFQANDRPKKIIYSVESCSL